MGQYIDSCAITGLALWNTVSVNISVRLSREVLSSANLTAKKGRSSDKTHLFFYQNLELSRWTQVPQAYSISKLAETRSSLNVPFNIFNVTTLTN